MKSKATHDEVMDLLYKHIGGGKDEFLIDETIEIIHSLTILKSLNEAIKGNLSINEIDNFMKYYKKNKQIMLAESAELFAKSTKLHDESRKNRH